MKLFENLTATSLAQLYTHAQNNAKTPLNTFATIQREVRKFSAQHCARTDNTFWETLRTLHTSSTPTIIERVGNYARIMHANNKKVADHVFYQLRSSVPMLCIIGDVCTPINWESWHNLRPNFVALKREEQELSDPITSQEISAIIEERERQQLFSELSRTHTGKRGKRRRIVLYEKTPQQEQKEQAQYNVLCTFREIMQQL